MWIGKNLSCSKETISSDFISHTEWILPQTSDLPSTEVNSLNSLKWQVKNTSFVQSSLKTSLASDILFLSKWLNTSMRFWNLFLMHQDYKSHTKNMIKRQYNQSKQTLELWKRHLTNSLFQESKSSLHTQDFHQVQQEPQRVQQRVAWTLLDRKFCSFI